MRDVRECIGFKFFVMNAALVLDIHMAAVKIVMGFGGELVQMLFEDLVMPGNFPGFGLSSKALVVGLVLFVKHGLVSLGLTVCLKSNRLV